MGRLDVERKEGKLMRHRMPISVVAVMLVALMVLGGLRPAVAQDATPMVQDATFEDTLDLPELQIFVT